MELNKMEQRYDAVLGVIRDGFTVTEVAKKFEVSRQTVHVWLVRYEEGGLEALVDRSHRPRCSPAQIDPRVEWPVLELRRPPHQLAIELGKFGVTVNAIAPGFIETEMTANTATRMGISFEDFKTMAAKQIPVARVGQPEDIATTVSFFVREESSFANGQVIYVAGGPTN
jgi:transposase